MEACTLQLHYQRQRAYQQVVSVPDLQARPATDMGCSLGPQVNHYGHAPIFRFPLVQQHRKPSTDCIGSLAGALISDGCDR